MTDRVEMRMNFQSAPETHGCFAVLRDGYVAQPLARGGAEVIAIARQSLLTVEDGATVIFSQITHRRALIPALGEIGLPLNHARKEIFRFFQASSLHGIDARTKQPVGFVIA